MKEILITGSTGFIGRALTQQLAKQKNNVVSAVRRPIISDHGHIKQIQIGNICSTTDWTNALDGIDIVIHLAGCAHIIDNSDKEDLLKTYQKNNTYGSLNLATQAIKSGVKRFIFISSIRVNGARNESPFTEKDPPNPQEAYAVSKMETEQGLYQLAEEFDMEIVIIRPPLVYGPNAPGNFGRLLRVVIKGIPLPLGAIHNQRSLVALDNLVDLIATCIDHPAAANQTFLAGDGEDLSTTELLQRVAKALGRPVYLIPVPVCILKFCSVLLNKRDVYQRLCSSLQVDISKARKVLGWIPPVSVDEGLRKAVEGLNV